MLRFFKRGSKSNDDNIDSDAAVDTAKTTIDETQLRSSNESDTQANPQSNTEKPTNSVNLQAGDNATSSDELGTENKASISADDKKDIGLSSEEDSSLADKSPGFFKRLSNKLSKTSSSLGDGLGRLLLGKKEIDDDLLEEIETQLVMADVGVDTTTHIMAKLAEGIEREALLDSDALYEQLKFELQATLMHSATPFAIDTQQSPFVILVVGVNGAGKTTTIGKLAKRLQKQGLSVMLAAGDTYRAAAVEQLQVWGERNDVPVVAQHTGADSASVIFDALQSAKSKGADVLIADTAGRLHNKDNLMEELKKVVRVMSKIEDTAPHEILLVLDATTGQNAVAQAEQFQKIIGVTGLAITKLDGTAKGGVLFAISQRLKLPIRFIGVGEQVDDLQVFNPEAFVSAIFSE